MARAEFTKKVKLKAFDRCGGRCEECRVKLRPGNIEYDHRIPCELGGTNDLSNCQPLCRACHGEKTAKQDAPSIAKARRLRAKHMGATSEPRSRLAGSRTSRIKKKVDGTVVDRNTGEPL